MIHVIIADCTIDQIIENDNEMKTEVKSLRKMGCIVKVKSFPTWELAESFESKHRGY